MSGVVRWEDPAPYAPGRKGGTGPTIPWALIAEQLKTNPGRWGVVFDGPQAPHIPQRIEKGRSPWFRPAGSFEVTTRAQPSGTTAVYVRYIGEPSPEVQR